MMKKEKVEEEQSADDLITEFQAGWNITNAIQGMFLLSFPYAILQGGVWAVIGIILVAVICYYTGMLLVDCMYERRDSGGKVELHKVNYSYGDIANQVWGPYFGRIMVTTFQLIELLMTCILYLILCGDMMIGCFGNEKYKIFLFIFLSAVLLLPCILLKSIKTVSWLSFWNTVTHLIINALVIVYCLTLYEKWTLSVVSLKVSIKKFPISLGIIVFSYTSQIFIPKLENSMIDKSRFRPMLIWTHFAAALCKVIFGTVGALAFGIDTDEVITNNLSNYTFRIIVNFALFVKALLTFPLPYYAAVEILEKEITILRLENEKQALAFGNSVTNDTEETHQTLEDEQIEMVSGYDQNENPETPEAPGQETVKRSKKIYPELKIKQDWTRRKLSRKILLFRSVLILALFFMAVAIPNFALLMGLIGSLSGTLLSLIWPCYFHLKIKWKNLNLMKKLVNFFIISFGIFVCLIGVYFSGLALFEAITKREFVKHFDKSEASKLPFSSLTKKNETDD